MTLHYCFFSIPRPTGDRIGEIETKSETAERELDDVVINNPHIEAILENEEWIEDASYDLFIRIILIMRNDNYIQDHKYQHHFQQCSDQTYNTIHLSISLSVV